MCSGNERRVDRRKEWPWTELTLASSGLAACAAPGVVISKNVSHRATVTHSRLAAFDEVSLWRSNRGLTISGRATPRRFGQRPGHVDVALVDGQGGLVDAFSIPVREQSYRGRWRGARFEARLSGPAPAGARFRLALHDPETHPRATTGTLQCGQNRAAASRE